MTSLKDVAGSVVLKTALKEKIIRPLRDRHEDFNGKTVLWGPPGTGKTYVTEALAGELQRTFIQVRFGASLQQLRQALTDADDRKPSVVLLDQAESIIKDPIACAILTEAGGPEVLLVAATSSPWDAETEFIEAGFFEYVYMLLPDQDARRELLTRHLGEEYLKEVDLERLTALTEGLAAPDFRVICERARKEGVRTRQREMDEEEAADSTFADEEPEIEEELEEEIERTPSVVGDWYQRAREHTKDRELYVDAWPDIMTRSQPK